MEIFRCVFLRLNVTFRGHGSSVPSICCLRVFEGANIGQLWCQRTKSILKFLILLVDLQSFCITLQYIRMDIRRWIQEDGYKKMNAGKDNEREHGCA